MICKKCGKEIAKDSKFCNYCGNVIEKDENKTKVFGIDRETMIRIIMISLFVLTIIFALASIPEAKKYKEEQAIETKESDNRIKLPISSKKAKGKDYEDVIEQLKDAGFNNIKLVQIEDLVTGWMTTDGEVESATINGESFEKGAKYNPDVEIVIEYHTFKSNNKNIDEENEQTQQNNNSSVEKATVDNTSTPEPKETITPEPTETPTPEPTETPTPEPTETPTPEPTETPTPEPTETPTPVNWKDIEKDTTITVISFNDWSKYEIAFSKQFLMGEVREYDDGEGHIYSVGKFIMADDPASSFTVEIYSSYENVSKGQHSAFDKGATKRLEDIKIDSYQGLYNYDYDFICFEYNSHCIWVSFELKNTKYKEIEIAEMIADGISWRQ